MTEYRTSVSTGGGMDFVLSDSSRDRHGTRINPNGWDFSSFLENPIALWVHGKDPNRGRVPIGNWENLRVVSNQVLATLAMARAGTGPFIDEMRSLVDQGILRAVSVGFEPLQLGKPGGPFEIERQELVEASLVAVGSNKNALAKARSLNISESTIRMAFGEQAEQGRTVVSTGRNAARPPVIERAPPVTRTLSQRIEDAQNDLNAKRDKLVELNGADDLDLDAIEELNGQVETAERTVSVLKASEVRIGLGTIEPPSPLSTAAPAVARRPLGISQREVSGFDLIVRAALVKGVSHFGGKPADQVCEERYPGHEATKIMVRADQTIGTTTVSGWALEIVQTAYADFLQALMPYSVYPSLRDRGIGLSFDGVGTVSIPSRTAGGAGGGFVAEGSPIRVGRITTAATTMTPKKLGVIVPFSRELAKRSTPAIEALVRQAIVEDTGVILDTALLDATASSTARPAGLLNGVSAAATGYGGGDYQAVVADLKALLTPFYAANAADNVTVLMNPAQGLALAMMPGPGPAGEFGWAKPLTDRLNIIESTNVTAGRLIALRNSDFATALGDAPEFDISEQATVHMEDTTPLEIVSGTGPTTADPVRSFFQTATIGVRMLMDVSWKMRRSGMVSWIDGTSW